MICSKTQIGKGKGCGAVVLDGMLGSLSFPERNLHHHSRWNSNITRVILVNKQLEAQFSFRIYLFQFSTCFEHHCAHHQENQLY